MTKYRLFIALVIGMIFSFPAAAKLYKWVDDKGVTHYGETIPPEYAHKDREQLNKAGRVIEKKTVLTPEERRAQDLEDVKKREDKEVAIERERRDNALVNTYSNAKEIDLARARNLQQVDARIYTVSSQIKAVDAKLIGLQEEVDGYAKAGKEIPASLKDDLKESQARLAKLQQDMKKSREEKAAVDARFDADKTRYLELTGKK